MHVSETKIITTPGGAKVTLKTHFTGQDHRAYRRVLLALDEARKADSLEALEDAMLDACLIEVNGSSENMREAVMKLDGADTEIILKECSDIVEVVTKKKAEILIGNTKTGSTEGM